jgi:hypothetical protein
MGARELASDRLLLGGTGAIVYSVALVSVPAAWIFGGLVAALAGWRLGLTG